MKKKLIDVCLQHLENVSQTAKSLMDEAQQQANEYGHSLTRELSFLAVHGLLHLLGYDHMNEEDEKIMFDKQKEILDSYDITR